MPALPSDGRRAPPSSVQLDLGLLRRHAASEGSREGAASPTSSRSEASARSGALPAFDRDGGLIRSNSSGSEASSSVGAPSLVAESERLHYLEVFMPTGDLAAARRLVVVFIDPPGAFPFPTASVGDALLDAAPHLFFDTVGSSIGAMYLRFNSFKDREACISLHDLPFEGARISFIREEQADRVVPKAETLAFISATRFPAEHFNLVGIARASSGFSDLVEIDHRVLTGRTSPLSVWSFSSSTPGLSDTSILHHVFYCYL